MDKTSGRILATCFSTGKTTDFRLLQASKLALADTVTCFADAGYQGVTRLFAKARTPHKKPWGGGTLTDEQKDEQKQENQEQKRERVCVEHTIRRLKVFRILSSRYRNRRKRFGLRFNLIAALLNKDIPNRSSKGQKTYERGLFYSSDAGGYRQNATPKPSRASRAMRSALKSNPPCPLSS